jgi:hypothetical protein
MVINLPAQAPDKVLSVVVMEIDAEPQVENGICQQMDGKVYLPGVLARATEGDKPVRLNFSTRGGGLEGWDTTGTRLTWTYKIEKPGTYKVDVITSEKGSADNPVWQGDHLVKISANGQEFEMKIVADEKEYNPRSHYWKKIHSYGKTISFDKPGTYQLTLEPVKFSEGKLGFTFREIKLVPVK